MTFQYSGNVYLRFAGYIAGYVASGISLYYALLAESVRHIPVVQLSRQDLLLEVIPFLGFLILLFGTTLGCLSQADINVDNQGISRVLWGWTWQSIRWDNTRLISAHPVISKGYSARVFTIFPKSKPRTRLMPSGKMVFTDKMKNATALVALLNR